MFVAIDFGSKKTVIYSTDRNGSNVEDEGGKREIQTVLEKTKIRSFGNSLDAATKDNIDLRSRSFLNDILAKSNQEDLLMFLNYLHQVIMKKGDYISGCLVIPEYYTEEMKQILKSIVEISDLRITSFVTHITAAAAAAVVRHHENDQELMIIDCGHHKTAVGAFSYKESELHPGKRYVIKKGARDFDEIIFNVIIKKYNFKDSKLLRERMASVVHKIKMGLNDLDTVTIKYLDENYDNFMLEVTKQEYLEGAQELLKEFETFFRDVEIPEATTTIEVIGNNSNNVFIQELLKRIEYKTTLNSSETAAYGAVMMIGLNSKKMKYKFPEAYGRDVYMKVKGSTSAPKRIFKPEDHTMGNIARVGYKRDCDFDVEIISEDKVIGLIKITKSEKKNEDVFVNVKINNFLLVEIVNIECESGVSFVFEDLSLDEKARKEIKEKDAYFRTTENNEKEKALMRNRLESFLDTVDTVLQKKFPNLLTSEMLNSIEEFRDNFFDRNPLTNSVEDELKLKKEVFDALGFIDIALAEKANKIKEENSTFIAEMKKHSFQYKTRSCSSFELSISKLQSFNDNFNLTLEKAYEYNPDELSFLTNHISNLLANILNEQKEEKSKEEEGIKKQKKEEAERAEKEEAERAAKEETEKATKEEKKAAANKTDDEKKSVKKEDICQ